MIGPTIWNIGPGSSIFGEQTARICKDDLDLDALKKEGLNRLALAEELSLGSVTDPALEGLQAYYILGSSIITGDPTFTNSKTT